MKTKLPPMLVSTAEFSPCRRWRYTLTRKWNHGDRMLIFIGLNPSTADETNNDPTVLRCINRAIAIGYDGMMMLNAFAYCATDPEDMMAAGVKANGVKNNLCICEACEPGNSTIVACWGVHGQFLGRDKQIIDLLCRWMRRTLYCLGTTKHGFPRHPLYVSYDTPVEVFREPG